MITEVALITISSVLFIQMGLCGAIETLLHIKMPIVSCPKCLTMWVCLIYLIAAHDYGILVSIVASFIASYCATWLALLYDAIAVLYNYLYEQISQEPDTSEASERASSVADTQASDDEVS